MGRVKEKCLLRGEIWEVHHQHIQYNRCITTNKSLHYTLPDYSPSYQHKLMFFSSRVQSHWVPTKLQLLHSYVAFLNQEDLK